MPCRACADKPSAKMRWGIAFPLPCPNSGTLNFPYGLDAFPVMTGQHASGISKTSGMPLTFAIIDHSRCRALER